MCLFAGIQDGRQRARFYEAIEGKKKPYDGYDRCKFRRKHNDDDDDGDHDGRGGGGDDGGSGGSGGGGDDGGGDESRQFSHPRYKNESTSNSGSSGRSTGSSAAGTLSAEHSDDYGSQSNDSSNDTTPCEEDLVLDQRTVKRVVLGYYVGIHFEGHERRFCIGARQRFICLNVTPEATDSFKDFENYLYRMSPEIFVVDGMGMLKETYRQCTIDNRLISDGLLNKSLMESTLGSSLADSEKSYQLDMAATSVAPPRNPGASGPPAAITDTDAHLIQKGDASDRSTEFVEKAAEKGKKEQAEKRRKEAEERRREAEERGKEDEEAEKRRKEEEKAAKKAAVSGNDPRPRTYGASALATELDGCSRDNLSAKRGEAGSILDMVPEYVLGGEYGVFMSDDLG
ncbi:hypothetical protein BU17DRAFT_78664 [Hysterangium stoloniferum]|nr:hypothetical protein BU17DRAFT_78664 [Hysterangium stoloniferum]